MKEQGLREVCFHREKIHTDRDLARVMLSPEWDANSCDRHVSWVNRESKVY